MNKEFRILYSYFLGQHGKVNKIPKKESAHKEKLLVEIKRVFPTFMHPYSFGTVSDEEANVSSKIINIFENHRTGFIFKVKRFFKR